MTSGVKLTAGVKTVLRALRQSAGVAIAESSEKCSSPVLPNLQRDESLAVSEACSDDDSQRTTKKATINKVVTWQEAPYD